MTDQTEREALARLIDPDAWGGPDLDDAWNIDRPIMLQDAALEVADAILAAGYSRSPAPEITADGTQAYRRGWLDGRDAAAKVIKRRWEGYAEECGFNDPTTGVTEYPGNGDEWVGDMQELEDEIRALTPPEMQRGLAGDMGELISAAQDVLDETDKILAIDPPPIKFRAPYGTLARLRGVLNRLSSGSGLQEGGGDE